MILTESQITQEFNNSAFALLACTGSDDWGIEGLYKSEQSFYEKWLEILDSFLTEIDDEDTEVLAKAKYILKQKYGYRAYELVMTYQRDLDIEYMHEGHYSVHFLNAE